MELKSESWINLLKEETQKVYFKNLIEFVEGEYSNYKVYPPREEVFASFEHCDLQNLKVLVLGQDPYHGPGQAHGLCFSVKKGIKTPPSLKNIYKEIQSEFGGEIANHGHLISWAEQGVLMLNATLTVKDGQPGSHQNIGWEQFTDRVIEIVSAHKQNVVFILWGAYAQKKKKLIDASKHLILDGAHPSPLSAYRGFFGCNHFKMCNDYLESNNLKPINWVIE